jgi:hypothetical protein
VVGPDPPSLVVLTWLYLLGTSIQAAFTYVIDFTGLLYASFYILTALAAVVYYRHRVMSDGTVYRPETRFRAVSWRFAARSSARLGPSRGATVAALPVDAVLARLVRSAGSV